MKKLLYLFVATSILLASCSKDCATPEPQEEWLFVHTAVSAKILNATTIVMPVTKKIFAFTDRPYRKQYYMTGQRYADLWTHSGENSFQDDPPNAVLTWVDGEEMKDVEVVITHAVSDSNTITYTINDTSGVIAGDIVDASLFVDGNNSVLSIGDSYGGGLIFYLDGKGGGLIAGSTNIGETWSGWNPWGCEGTKILCDGSQTNPEPHTAIGTGQQNTIAILATCSTKGIAAEVCASSTLGGYNDWFLPSKNELAAMFWNLHKKGLGGFGNSSYWSSSERCSESEYSAYFYDFSFTPSTYQIWDFFELKSVHNYVRAVRAF